MLQPAAKSRSEPVLILLMAAIVAGMLIVREADYDTWWHMALGRWIVEHGQIPERDPFAFTVPPDKYYMVDSWLFGPISYWIYEAAGINGFIAMKALAAAGIFLALFARSRIHERRHPILVAAFFVAVMFVIRVRLVARPHTLGLLMVALYLLTLELAIHRHRAWLVVMAFVQIVWTNMHPSFFLGLVIPGIYLAGAGLDQLIRLVPVDGLGGGRAGSREKKRVILGDKAGVILSEAKNLKRSVQESRPHGSGEMLRSAQHDTHSPHPPSASPLNPQPSTLQPFFLCLAACFVAALACLVNPDGLGRPTYIFHMFFDQQLYQVREYMPLQLRDYRGPRGFFLILAAVTLVAAFLRRRYAWVGLQIAFGYIGLTSARFFYEMLAVFTPTCPALLMNALEKTLPWPLRYFEQRPAAAKAAGLTFAGLLLVVCIRLDPDWGLGLKRNNDLPIVATDFLEREQVLEKTGGRMFNTYNVGGYLIWRLAPRHQVFIDSRIHLFYGQFFDDYMALPDARRHDLWAEYIRRYTLTVAVVRHPMFGGDGKLYNCTEAMFPRDEWALVFFDDAAIVYVRRVPESADIIVRNEFRYLDPQILDLNYLVPFMQNPADGAAMSAEVNRAMAAHPNSAKLHFLRAFLNAQTGRNEEAIADLRRALEINPELGEARYILKQQFGLEE